MKLMADPASQPVYVHAPLCEMKRRLEKSRQK